MTKCTATIQVKLGKQAFSSLNVLRAFTLCTLASQAFERDLAISLDFCRSYLPIAAAIGSFTKKIQRTLSASHRSVIFAAMAKKAETKNLK